MDTAKKKAGDPDWEDPDLRESELRTDFPLCEKDEFKEATIRTKQAHERAKKMNAEIEDNPSSE